MIFFSIAIRSLNYTHPLAYLRKLIISISRQRNLNGKWLASLLRPAGLYYEKQIFQLAVSKNGVHNRRKSIVLLSNLSTAPRRWWLPSRT